MPEARLQRTRELTPELALGRCIHVWYYRAADDIYRCRNCQRKARFVTRDATTGKKIYDMDDHPPEDAA